MQQNDPHALTQLILTKCLEKISDDNFRYQVDLSAAGEPNMAPPEYAS